MDNSMKDLKILLFEKCKNAYSIYRFSYAAFPEGNWDLSKRAFHALYDVIVSAGLKDEFETWGGLK